MENKNQISSKHTCTSHVTKRRDVYIYQIGTPRVNTK